MQYLSSSNTYSDIEGEKTPQPFLVISKLKILQVTVSHTTLYSRKHYEEHTTKHCPVLERILDAQAEKSGTYNVSHNLVIQNAQQHKLLETRTFESYPRNPAAFLSPNNTSSNPSKS